MSCLRVSGGENRASAIRRPVLSITLDVMPEAGNAGGAAVKLGAVFYRADVCEVGLKSTSVNNLQATPSVNSVTYGVCYGAKNRP